MFIASAKVKFSISKKKQFSNVSNVSVTTRPIVESFFKKLTWLN